MYDSYCIMSGHFISQMMRLKLTSYKNDNRKMTVGQNIEQVEDVLVKTRSDTKTKKAKKSKDNIIRN